MFIVGRLVHCSYQLRKSRIYLLLASREMSLRVILYFGESKCKRREKRIPRYYTLDFLIRDLLSNQERMELDQYNAFSKL